MNADDRTALRDLIAGSRQAALATVEAGLPQVSMVLYALERRAAAPPAVLIYVSGLAAHTRQMRAEPRVALLVARPDCGETDPQALARVSLQGLAAPIPLANPDYAAARACYLAHLPQQAYLFDFSDFTLFRIELQAARFVGGFARAFSLDATRLAQVLAF
ncbi:MAG: pyridoxamine 5'-phosphate oxidase family protein [Oscillochloridaceae bacterium umkhey_bin13]